VNGELREQLEEAKTVAAHYYSESKRRKLRRQRDKELNAELLSELGGAEAAHSLAAATLRMLGAAPGIDPDMLGTNILKCGLRKFSEQAGSRAPGTGDNINICMYYIYIYIYVFQHMYGFLSLFLFLYVYYYIYIYIHIVVMQISYKLAWCILGPRNTK